MREGQEEQRRRVVPQEQVGHALDGVVREVEEVAMGERAALGATRGAGGVDQRGGGGAVQAVARREELLVGHGLASGLERGDAARVDFPDVGEVRQGVLDLRDRGRVGGRLDDDALRAGVGDDPFDLLGRRGFIDRHGHGAGGPDREIGKRPLVACAAHEGDPVARRDAARDQALGQGVDLDEELSPVQVRPSGTGLLGEGNTVRGLTGIANRKVGESALRCGGNERGDDDVLHGGS